MYTVMCMYNGHLQQSNSGIFQFQMLPSQIVVLDARLFGGINH